MPNEKRFTTASIGPARERSPGRSCGRSSNGYWARGAMRGETIETLPAGALSLLYLKNFHTVVQFAVLRGSLPFLGRDAPATLGAQYGVFKTKGVCRWRFTS